MSALQWVLVVVSWLTSFAISGAALVLASMFRDSGAAEDRTIGLVIGAVGVLLLALPATGTWLLAKTSRTGLATALLGSAVGIAVVGLGLVFAAIEAAARP